MFVKGKRPGNPKTQRNPNGAGRKSTIIDWGAVIDLLKIGSSAAEVCAVLGISDRTLRKQVLNDHNMEWAEFARCGKAKGRNMLRSKQFEVAMDGDKTMLIWLGKQRLGQAEKQETRHTITNIDVKSLSDEDLERYRNEFDDATKDSD